MWESEREREREWRGGGRRQNREGKADSPLSAHPPIYGSPFQQGHSRWWGSVDVLFSWVNSSEPSVWFVWGRLISSEDPLNCLTACVSSIDLHCVSCGALRRLSPKDPRADRAFHQLPFPAFQLHSGPEPPALGQPAYTVKWLRAHEIDFSLNHITNQHLTANTEERFINELVTTRGTAGQKLKNTSLCSCYSILCSNDFCHTCVSLVVTSTKEAMFSLKKNFGTDPDKAIQDFFSSNFCHIVRLDCWALAEEYALLSDLWLVLLCFGWLQL